MTENWKNIPGFENYAEWYQKELQEHWEENNLTYQDAQQWISVGLEPADHEFASYLKKNNFTPEQYTYYKENKTIQERLDYFFSNKDQVKIIDLKYLKSNQPDGSNSEDLTNNSQLIINDYPELKKIHGRYITNLAQLTITNCPQLEEISIQYSENLQQLILDNLPNLKGIDCSDNYLTEIKLPNPGEKLKNLKLRNNNFSEQDLSFLGHLVNLEQLFIDNSGKGYWKRDKKNAIWEKIDRGFYNRFNGSLEPLKNMSKLERLWISNTNIESGLEYLPESIESFYCSADKEDAKVKAIVEDWRYFNWDLKRCKKFNISRKWLDENYPENEECKTDYDEKDMEESKVRKGREGPIRRRRKEGGESSFPFNNYGRKKEQITDLDISYEKINKCKKEENQKTKLKGGLWLKGFTNLQKLNCSEHQLTDIDLSDCSNLIELNCSNNNLKDLNFLKPLSKLEKLSIKNNPELVAKNLDSLSHLANLKELDISNCGKNLKGSLKSLENLKQLEKVSISQTNISEGLEYLPENCKELNCDLDYDYSSVEIAKQISKFSQGEGKYDLVKWRIDQANNNTSSIVPLERLFVIRGNLKKFAKKWSKEAKNSWCERLINYWQNQQTAGDKINELSKLQNPEELSSQWYALTGIQYANRAVSVAGGIALIYDYLREGGWVAVVCPFVEAGVSYAKEEFHDSKEKKWNEFITDSEEFLDNYHELLGIIKKISPNSDLGKVSKALQNLDEKSKEILKIHGEIELEELIANRKSLSEDLAKGKEKSGLWGIVSALEKLEDITINYKKKGSLIEEEEINQQQNSSIGEEQQQLASQAQETDNKKKDKQVAIDIGENYQPNETTPLLGNESKVSVEQNQQIEQIPQTLQLAYGTPGSSQRGNH